MNCPNCNSKLERSGTLYEGNHLCEDFLQCPKMCYEEMFSYGYTDVDLYNSINNSRESYGFSYKSSDLRIKEVKKNILKFFGKLKVKKIIG